MKHFCDPFLGPPLFQLLKFRAEAKKRREGGLKGDELGSRIIRRIRESSLAAEACIIGNPKTHQK